MLGEATKVAPVFMQGGKEYVGLMELHGDVSESELDQALKVFTGAIYQVPPIRAAVARKPRIREVYYFEMLEREGRYVLFRLGCSAGTYVRKVCHDVGEYLGVGAHMEELRRTRAGPFEESTSYNLLTLQEAVTLYRESGDESLLRKVVQPVENCLALVPKVYVLDTAVDAVCHGADLMAAGISMLDSDIERQALVAVVTLKNEVVAIGRAVMNSQEMMEATEGLAVDIERVIMRKSTYPSVWKGGLQHVH
ncbi:MAG: RNA-guided pseudouridylation complex pseudouridine synthase subunit Cbf5 [Candidatus Caldarchaeum sp.]|nr:RNA-guided pseudouridylation complex pseudouridine synthase subunit Cbf5 [Candidatus Caldarchaeum sp.]